MPQLLRRPKPEETAIQSDSPKSTEQSSQIVNEQRDTLLSIFSKAGIGAASNPAASVAAPGESSISMQAPTKGVSAWNDFSAKSQASGPRPMSPEKKNDGVSAGDGLTKQRWNETYKQTPVLESWLGGPRKVTATETTVHEGLSGQMSAGLEKRPAIKAGATDMSRSRLGSMASMASNGSRANSIADGMRSPTTPIEAKGFLLDYLNGVVKGEQLKGSKRPGP